MEAAVDTRQHSPYALLPLAAAVGVVCAAWPGSAPAVAAAAAVGLAALLIKFPELLLGVFVFVGVFKSSGAITGMFPFDITLGLAVVMSGLFIGRFILARKRFFPVDLFLLLAFAQAAYMMMNSLVIAPDKSMAVKDSLRFVAFNLLFLWGPLTFAGEPKRLWRALLSVVGVGAVHLSIFYYNFFFQREAYILNRIKEESTMYATALGEDYITFGLLAAQVFVFLAALSLFSRRRWAKALLLAVAGAVLPALVASASRGAALAGAAALVTLGLHLRFARARGNGFLVMLAVAAAGAAVWWVYTRVDLSGIPIHRLIFAGGGAMETVMIRRDLFLLAAAVVEKGALFGGGVGSMIYYGTSADPHNLLLQVTAFYGLVGVFLFAAQGLVFVRLFPTLQASPNLLVRRAFVIALAGFMVYFADSFVSGNLPAFRNMWFYMGIIHALYWTARLEETTQTAGEPG